MNMSLTDSRRLTGPNLYWDKPSAIIDVTVDDSVESVIQHWSAAVAELLEACGQSEQKTHYRTFDGGASLLISAEIDALYAMCELNELAWTCTESACSGGPAPELENEIPRLKELFASERRPGLLQLQHDAAERAVPFLWDDDEVSVGLGRFSKTWPYEDIPASSDVAWENMRSIPLALVSGTNGKSTTVRMLAAIISAAGLRAGLTSTDFIKVGDEIVEKGDYSGPGGARQLLRHPNTDMAVLEVARGGLMRRGLGVTHADAALLTNVAADHFGEYGINTVAELIQAKFVVRRALSQNGPLVLNADDQGLVEYARSLDNTIWWFSMDSGQQLIRQNRANGAGACWLEDDSIFSNAGGSPGEKRRITRVQDITASRAGLVRHNVQNAMGATLLGLALGLPDDAIRAGLLAFRGDESDNPGRGNWFERDGVRILVDFAHNEHGLAALAATINGLEAKRVVLMLGQAGDRDDELVRSLTRVGCGMNPARLLVCAMPGYERGRALWDVPRLIREEALLRGMAESNIEMFDSLLVAAGDALKQARSGDVLVLLALTQREEVLQMVHNFING